MANDDLYDLRIVLRVKVKKWRIDDQSNEANWEWSTNVYDRNLQQWINIVNLKRPGEDTRRENIVKCNLQISI
jgi:hypothetical protein